jgi:hypothetical protein
MPVSVCPSCFPTPLRFSAAGAHARASNSLFLASDDEEGGVPMDLSPGPSPRSNARGCTSPACSATAAATDDGPASTCHGARGVPPVPPCTVPNIIVLGNEGHVLSFDHHACVAMLARTAASISASVGCAFASMAPAAPRYSGCRQQNWQAVNYAMNTCNAAHESRSSSKVPMEDGEVTPAVAVDVPTLGLVPARGAGRSCAPAAGVTPAPEASTPADCGS